MNDENYVHALRDVQRDLQSVKASGGYLVWLGLLTAVTLFAGIGVTAYAYLGHQAFLSLSPFWYLAGGLVAAGPAFACLAAGFMARQSLQTARANAVILRASQMLLMPADAAGARIARIGEAVRGESARIEKLVQTSQASFADFQTRLKAEREAVEKSVHESREQVRQMLDMLSNERQALAELTSAVDSQTAAMAETIPKQARFMAEAARAAQHEIAQSDEALNRQLSALDGSSQRLAETLRQLTVMSQHGEQSTEDLIVAIAGLENRLKESAKVVDAAVRASDLAGLAATETGDALNAAVASALDGTREASVFIRQQSREASAEAMKAMAELKQAAAQAEQALSAVGIAARAQADETEQRMDRMGDHLFQAATRATSAVESGLERARQRMERASALLLGIADDDASISRPAPVEDPREFFVAPSPVTQPEAPRAEPTPPVLRQRQPDEDSDARDNFDTTPDVGAPVKADHIPSHDEDDFDEDEFFNAPTEQPSAPPKIIYPTPAREDWMTQTSEQARDLLIDPNDKMRLLSEKDSGLTWRDLLAGLDTPAEERDESARYILSEIEESNVELQGAFNPKAVKKIAAAARRGERQRRRAVRDHAGSAVQTLIFRLQDDVSFLNSADRFLTVEEPDALRALTETEKSRSVASPRLAAYLLLDSAMSSV